MSILGIGAIVASLSTCIILLMNAVQRVKFPTVQMLEAEGMCKRDAICAFTHSQKKQGVFFRLYVVPVVTMVVGLGMTFSGILQKTGLWNLFEILSKMPVHPSKWTAIGILTSCFSLIFMFLFGFSVWLSLTINGNKEVKDQDKAEQKVHLFNSTMTGFLTAAIFSLIMVFF